MTFSRYVLYNRNVEFSTEFASGRPFVSDVRGLFIGVVLLSPRRSIFMHGQK